MNSTSQPPTHKGPNQESNAPQEGNKKRPPSTLGEIVMVIFVGFTVSVYVFLAWVSIKTLHIDQRAWLEVSGVNLPSESVKEETPIIALAKVTNNGKTPAKKVVVQFVVVVLNSSSRVEFEYVEKQGTAFNGVMVPKQNIPVTVYGGGKPAKPDILTKTEAENLLGGRMYIAIYGRGEYKDIFGEQHWFHYCGWNGYYPLGAAYYASDCTAYNDVGDGPLPEGEIK